MSTMYLSSHALFTTIAIVSFLLILLNSRDDELQQQALNNALINSITISVIGTIGYIFYMLVSGCYSVNIHAVLFVLDGISIITLLLYLLELKNIHFSAKGFNERTAKIFEILLLIPTAVATISLTLNFARKLININLPDYLGSNQGIIRYDELLLFSCVILWAVITSFMPRMKKMNRAEYKERHKKIDKAFKRFYLIYGMFFLLLIVYVIYRVVGP